MKRYSKIQTIIIASLIFALLSVCERKKDEPTPAPAPTDGKVKVAEGAVTGAGAKIEVFADQMLLVGYNKMYFRLTDSASGSIIDDSHIHLKPEMDMGMMKHGAPISEVTDKATNTLFTGAVVFTMPSGSAGTWKLGLKVHNHKTDQTGTTSFNVVVSAPGVSTLKMVQTTNDSTKLYIAYVAPTKPKVGVNDIDLALYYQKDAYSYPEASDYTVEIKPEMPSMGHGSPNNVNPSYTSNGIFSGKVNFTMSGDWLVNVTVKKGGAVVATTSFGVTVP